MTTGSRRERGFTPKPGLIALIERRCALILAHGYVFHEAHSILIPAEVKARHPLIAFCQIVGEGHQ
jgi:hypothetical protein